LSRGKLFHLAWAIKREGTKEEGDLVGLWNRKERGESFRKCFLRSAHSGGGPLEEFLAVWGKKKKACASVFHKQSTKGELLVKVASIIGGLDGFLEQEAMGVLFIGAEIV